MADTQETIADIIAEARDKYTVHECNQCAWRKCCSRGFGSEECGKFRESIWLHLGIEDGYFTQLLNRLDAANKRERGDASKLREALKDIGRIVEQIRLLYSDYPYEIHVIARKASAALAAPPRHCDTMSESVCAAYFDALYKGNRDGVCMATTEREKNIHRYYCKYINWLFAMAKAKGDAK